MKVIIISAVLFVLVAVSHALTATQITQVVNAHNAERALVGLGPVTYNTSIEQITQNYVNTCPSGHSGAQDLGENIYWGSSQDLTSAVNLWSSEKQYWNCATNECCKGNSCSWSYCGHYTQVVWYSSTQIGCGIKLCGSTYTVICNYYRPGNFNCNPYCNPQVKNCPGTTTPVAPPRATPVAAPRAAPVAAPVTPPRAAPVAAPKAPVAAPVAPPRATPVAAPRAATPRSAPVAAPRAVPVASTPTDNSSTPQSDAPVNGQVPQNSPTGKPNSPQAAGSLTSGSNQLVYGVVAFTLCVFALL